MKAIVLICALIVLAGVTVTETHIYLNNLVIKYRNFSQVAKRPQTSGKSVYGKIFKACNTPGPERKLIRRFQMPSEDQGKCYAKNVLTELGLVKEDNTLDADKVATQLTDYGSPVPAMLEELRVLDIQDVAFVQKLFTFLAANSQDLKQAFHGNRQESFE